eukprot:gene8133-9003_t
MPIWSCFRGNREKETYPVLDYSHTSLLTVPPEVYEHAVSLEELYLDGNQLQELPKALFTLQKLKTLNISDNEIRALPSNVSNLVHLIELDASKNGFLELPENIRGLKSLEVFDASVNPLGSLPDGFTLLLNLTYVSLNDTFLEFLPANIGRLAKLEVLEVRENHLSALPKSMNRLTQLRRLDIGNNEFNELPEVIGTLTRLKELWIDCNQISSLPSELGDLKFLETIDASENRITWVADELGEADLLTDLHLTTNLLVQIPENLCKLKRLETLKVDDNHLTHLPTSIGGMSKLQELIVSGNELETLPPGVGLLRELITLNCDENFIESLPAELGSCNKLSVLSMRKNKLISLPDEIGRLANLSVLNVSSNMLENLPFSLMKLKKLKALWISANQSKPLIPLQTEFDPGQEKRFLTCYMFPQHPISEAELESVCKSDERSFHASLFEEEWRKRTSVNFDLEDADQQVIRLTRQPTPYPKDIRDKIQHFRDVAIAKQQAHRGEMPQVYDNPLILDEEEKPEFQPIAMTNEERDNVDSACDEISQKEEEYRMDCQTEDIPTLQSTPPIHTMTGSPRFHGVRRDVNSPPIQTRFDHHSPPDIIDGPPDEEQCHDDIINAKNVKSSADSGLGSTEIDDQQQWKNEYPTIPEQGESFRIVIKKNPHLGFSISGGFDAPPNPFRPGDKGIFITKILPDGPAKGILEPGDKVLKVNGYDFTKITHSAAVDVLKSCDSVELILERPLVDE